MRKFNITVNGVAYEVEVEEVDAQGAAPAAPAKAAPAAPQAAAPAAPKAAPKAPVAAGAQVNAPMPGTILDVKVQQGQAVKKGDVLMVLEAMKMENEIMAPHDATVAQVLADVGTKVDTGMPIIVLG